MQATKKPSESHWCGQRRSPELQPHSGKPNLPQALACNCWRKSQKNASKVTNMMCYFKHFCDFHCWLQYFSLILFDLCLFGMTWPLAWMAHPWFLPWPGDSAGPPRFPANAIHYFPLKEISPPGPTTVQTWQVSKCTKIIPKTTSSLALYGVIHSCTLNILWSPNANMWVLTVEGASGVNQEASWTWLHHHGDHTGPNRSQSLIVQGNSKWSDWYMTCIETPRLVDQLWTQRLSSYPAKCQIEPCKPSRVAVARHFVEALFGVSHSLLWSLHTWATEFAQGPMGEKTYVCMSLHPCKSAFSTSLLQMPKDVASRAHSPHLTTVTTAPLGSVVSFLRRCKGHPTKWHRRLLWPTCPGAVHPPVCQGSQSEIKVWGLQGHFLCTIEKLFFVGVCRIWICSLVTLSKPFIFESGHSNPN